MNVIFEAINKLYEYGALDIFLPFLFIFTLLFLLFQKIGLASKKHSAIISASIAGLAIILHIVYGSGQAKFGSGPFKGMTDVVYFINTFLPAVVIWIIVIFVFLIMVSFMGVDLTQLGGWFKIIVVIAIVAIVGYLFTKSTQILNKLPINSEAFYSLIILAVFGFIIWWIMHGGESSSSSGPPPNRAVPPPRPK